MSAHDGVGSSEVSEEEADGEPASADDEAFKPLKSFYKKDCFYYAEIEEHPTWALCQLKTLPVKDELDGSGTFWLVKVVWLNPVDLASTKAQALRAAYSLTYMDGKVGKSGWCQIPAKSIGFEVMMTRNSAGKYTLTGLPTRQALKDEWDKPHYAQHFDAEKDAWTAKKVKASAKNPTKARKSNKHEDETTITTIPAKEKKEPNFKKPPAAGKKRKRKQVLSSASEVTSSLESSDESESMEETSAPEAESLAPVADEPVILDYTPSKVYPVTNPPPSNLPTHPSTRNLPLPDEAHIQLLKKAVLAYIQRRWASATKWCKNELCEHGGYSTYTAYKDALLATGKNLYWISDYEWKIIAEVFDVNVVMYVLNPINACSFGKGVERSKDLNRIAKSGASAINLLFMRSQVHYDVLVPVTFTDAANSTLQIASETPAGPFYQLVTCDNKGNCGWEGASRQLVRLGLLPDADKFFPG